MKIVSQRTTSAGGATWVTRAGALARGIPGQYGSRHEVIDGYIIEGKNVGGRRTGTVIDPPGAIALLGPASDGDGRSVPVGSRDAFDPAQPVTDIEFGDPYSGEFPTVVFGPPITGTRQWVGWGASASTRAGGYLPGVVRNAAGTLWVFVAFTPAGSGGFDGEALVIHESYVRTFAPAYELSVAKVTGFDWLVRPIPMVAFGEGTQNIATTVFKYEAVTLPNEAIKHTAQTSLLLMRYDRAAGSLVGATIPLSAFPERVRPGTVTDKILGYDAFERVASSVLIPTDIVVTANGSTIVAFSYQSEQQDGEETISWVWANGKATFSPQGVATVEVFDVDVQAGPSSELVAEMELPTDIYRLPGMAWVTNTGALGGSVGVYARKVTSLGTQYVPVPPYSEETVDGVVVATAAQGFGAVMSLGGATPDNLAVRNLGFSSARVSAATKVVRRATPSEAANTMRTGLLFADGARFHYEEVASRSPTQAFSMYISCAQEEVRGQNGVLLCPSTLVVALWRGTEAFIGIRKGPIWPEDGYKPTEEYWSFSSLPGTTELPAPFYVGNTLMAYGHGEYFARQADD